MNGDQEKAQQHFSVSKLMQLKKNFRAYLNNYYQKQLNLVPIFVPWIQQYQQVDFFNLNDTISFSNNTNFQPYQIISNHRKVIVDFFVQHLFKKASGVSCERLIWNKNANVRVENILNEVDYWEIKVRYDCDQNQLMINYFQQMWSLITRFIAQYVSKITPLMKQLLQIDQPTLLLDHADQLNTKLATLVPFSHHLATYQVVIISSKNRYNYQINLAYHDPGDDREVWALVVLGPQMNPLVLMSGFYDQVAHEHGVQTTASICFNFAWALLLVTQQNHVKALDFMYCQNLVSHDE